MGIESSSKQLSASRSDVFSYYILLVRVIDRVIPETHEETLSESMQIFIAALLESRHLHGIRDKDTEVSWIKQKYFSQNTKNAVDGIKFSTTLKGWLKPHRRTNKLLEFTDKYSEVLGNPDTTALALKLSLEKTEL